MAKLKKLTKPQERMLVECLARGFVLAPAGVPTAWTLEHRGLLKQVKCWTVTRHLTAHMISETYKYEMHLTDKGRALAEEFRDV